MEGQEKKGGKRERWKRGLEKRGNENRIQGK